MEYTAIGSHRSEYPEPISFSKGALLVIGDKYQGPESWNNWYFCTGPGQAGGWVPGQVIECIDECRGRTLEDYTARELDVAEGDALIGSRMLNGWVWCCRESDGESGWVPLEVLRKKPHNLRLVAKATQAWSRLYANGQSRPKKWVGMVVIIYR